MELALTIQPAGKPTSSFPATNQALKRAAAFLRSNDIVAFPTETVYGLGSSAISPAAIKKIYAAKGRPSDNPLIVHVSDRRMLESLLPEAWPIPPAYEALMTSFWPGPLTLLFPTKSKSAPAPRVSDSATCGLPTVAIRMPAHPVARALIATAAIPLTAPSANASGRPSPTTAAHVQTDLDGRLKLILDGGPCDVGVESTVVDGVSDPTKLKILRLGGVGVEDIEAALAANQACQDVKVSVFRRDFRDGDLEDKPTTPGMKYKHYAPDSQVIILETAPRIANGMTNGSTSHDLPTLRQVLLDHARALGNRPKKPFANFGLVLLDDGPLRRLFHLGPPGPSPYAMSSCSLTQIRDAEPHRDSDDVSPPLITVHISSCWSPRAAPAAAAQNLFALLRYHDARHFDAIYVEAVEEKGVGAAVMERLRKAAGGDDAIVKRVRVD